MDRENPLIARLAAGLQPVRPQQSRTGWMSLALAVLATGIIVHLLFGLQPVTILRSAGRWFVLGELLLAGLGLAAAFATIRMAWPERAGRPGAFWVVCLASLAPLSALALLAIPGAHPSAAAGVDGHWQCAAMGTASAALVAGVLVRWLRRGAPASPTRAGLYAGIASGALGSAVYGLSCPLGDFHHWTLWHFVPVLACALAGRVLLPRWLRW
ncbi:NrsF family protein [Luteimonas saliphila]|uniref:NrsF family protein n=1 Tax=Luteimonas saliphila TaxID=2804919 RepID=UPI00192DA22C|nr:DUF1109 domain-containing protein [Luteimonas saliphila]